MNVCAFRDYSLLVSVWNQVCSVDVHPSFDSLSEV